MRFLTRSMGTAILILAASATAARKPAPEFGLKISMESVVSGDTLSDWEGVLHASGSPFSDSGPVAGPASGDLVANQYLVFTGKKGSFSVRITNVRIVRVPSNASKPKPTWSLEASFAIAGTSGEYAGISGGGQATGKRVWNGDRWEHTWSARGFLDGNQGA